MIEQYLSNTNENATVSISQKFWELNKALALWGDVEWREPERAAQRRRGVGAQRRRQ